MTIDQTVNKEVVKVDSGRELVGKVLGCTTAATLGLLYGAVMAKDDAPIWAYAAGLLVSTTLSIFPVALVNIWYEYRTKRIKKGD